MQYKMFFVPLTDDGEAQEELNAFLRTKRVLSVDKVFAGGGWTFCVEWLEGGKSKEAAKRGATPRVDYREVLSIDDFAVFSRLREKRKELARRDGVDLYTIATNEQLADMVRMKAGSIDDLKSVKGVGEARACQYGADLLAVLCDPVTKGEKVVSECHPL
jgi:superfamily II DNA helicase RecQ